MKTLIFFGGLAIAVLAVIYWIWKEDHGNEDPRDGIQ